MIEAITKYGSDLKPPCYHELRVSFLKKEVVYTVDLMKGPKDDWQSMAVLMYDGWTDRKKRTLISFLVNCPAGTMFIESVDASSYGKTGCLSCLTKW